MTDTPLANRTVLIIGAATGIGRAIAEPFAAAGAAVICADLDSPGASATAEAIRQRGGRAEGLACDVTRATEVDSAVTGAEALFGGLDCLVYAAAAPDPSGTVLEIEPETFEQILAVNLTGAFLAARAAIPAMQRRGGGTIIFIASQLAHVASAGRPAYCASKGGLVQFARVLAVDHAADNIRVNTLSPGGVATVRLERRYGSLDNARAVLDAKHPLGRIAEVEEIARAALFLATEQSSFMTGADLLVDGGYCAV